MALKALNRLEIVLVAMGAFPTVASAGAVLHVDGAAPPAGDGLSWTTAFADLQAALDAAAGLPPGVEIRIAAGTYLPSFLSQPGNPRSATFLLTPELSLLGGFAGLGGPDPDERDPAVHVTILSGDLAGDDGPDFANRDDNCYHVLTIPDVPPEAAPVVIDGLTIRGGNADVNLSGRFGGAILTASSTTVRRCTISDNRAYEGGSAIANGSYDTLLVEDCVFRGNRVVSPYAEGGAIKKTHGHLSVAGCIFEENHGADKGGAIAFSYGESLTIRGSSFNSNQAEVGAGVHGLADAILLEGCTLTGQIASAGGGGFVVGASTFTAIDCVIHENDGGTGGGAGISVADVATYVNCLFARNSSDFLSAIVDSSTVLNMTNCVFSQNVAGKGGAMHVGQSGNLVHCSFSGNVPGGVHTEEYSHLVVANSTLRGSNLLQIGGTATVTSSNIQGGWPGPGNIDVDPLFVQASTDDLRLSYGSPCLDAGDTALLPPDTFDLDGDGDTAEPLPFDLAGSPRVAGAAVDMGAYEGEHEPGGPGASAHDVDQGESVVLVPGGGVFDPLGAPFVIFQNLSGPDNASVTVVQHEADLHPGAGGFSELGLVLAVETSLPAGTFLLTASVPFAAADLGSAAPFDLDLSFFNEASGRWSLAVSGNTAPSPGHAGPLGDRVLIEGGGFYGVTGELGDFGVYWDPALQSGMVWANVDHATDFGFGVNLCPADCAPVTGDGSVNVLDLTAVVVDWSIGMADGTADINRDGSVDTHDLASVIDAWGGCP